MSNARSRFHTVSSMIGFQTASDAISPRCSRRPAMRPEVRNFLIAVMLHSAPVTVLTPREVQSRPIERKLSPARRQSPVGWWGFGGVALGVSALELGLVGVSVARLVELRH
jgi:hypothetical protein